MSELHAAWVRIEELEAENARLKQCTSAVEFSKHIDLGAADLLKALRERDEARAACAAKDLKLRQLEWSGENDTCPACWQLKQHPGLTALRFRPSAPRLYRDSVLEEAARVADAGKRDEWSPGYIAERIRALKSSEPEGGT